MILAKITEKRLIKDYFILELKLDEPLHSQPGQFIMIKVKDDVNLPKPFSIMNEEGNFITLFIKIVGQFSLNLSKLKSGDEVLLRGPYGIPFLNKIEKNDKYFLLGGGCGSAPLIYFYKKYPQLVKDYVFAFKEKYVETLFSDLTLYVDEKVGKTPLEYLSENISQIRECDFLVCGSKNLIKNFFEFFPMLKTKSYVSLEENMGCGAGLCKGCPVQTNQGIKMICKDGPIFKADEVNLEWI
ncbi:FAD-binding oxidoreductase [Petrotoga sp. 9PWA.NaAc.5.4]|uniref:iron-sulfur cluster-binding protein n=1 Tax=Petrotoga sp. 9PWA.NaAc.5.4 TaxID=1434328 RepID=UPI000CBFD3B0|nr:FAD-binding oxidoreductase [Petrotoga sp. 9PWA.NaAc.5.4]PNR92456.1 dihydroorotate dehydrogenase [Petrotoga sp. 9PWA.NaAc.5.4]